MLRAHQVSYSQKRTPILKKMDVAVGYGEFLAIVGPNGAGKSTLLSLLANELGNLDVPIVFKKKAFEEWELRELPMHKAKFSQSNSQDIPLQVKDVVLMGRYPYFNASPTREDIEAVHEAMGKVDVLPLATRDYNTLSGGEKQRVHLARVLAQMDNPITHKLVLLDEPLNNLDVLHQHRVLHAIKDFTETGSSAIVVLHDLNLAAQFADRVLLMKNGGIVSHDAPQKVFTKETLSRVYNFPCTVCPHPVNNNPMIIFGI